MKILCVLYDDPKEGMPTAEALVYGILQLQKKIRRQAKEKLA